MNEALSMTDEPRAVGEHLIGESTGDANGPTLIVFGGVHGNEAAGVRALEKIAAELAENSGRLRGRVVFLAGNTRALARGARYVEADLNRHWTPANIARNRPGASGAPQISEDYEQRELLEILERVLGTARAEVYALDLHSTSADGAPFATVGDTLRNRAFALKLPITILLGIEEELDGTILEYLNNQGAVTLGYEGGQHFAEKTLRTHEALVRLALAHSGVLARTDADGFAEHEKYLRAATGRPRLVEIRYRHAIDEADEFAMEPGFENFQPVRRGQLLARQKSGAVVAPESGLILMPLYQKLGADGFFLGREVAPFWLKLSGILRRLGLARVMPLLPGVKKSADAETLEIDTRIARFFPLQVFHLLGFRKLRRQPERLVVSRRRFDTRSPFGG